MGTMNRRDFLKLSSAIVAGAGLMTLHTDALAASLEKLTKGHPRVAWLQGLSCSGCSVSLLNTLQPGPVELLTDYISLVYHQTVGAAQGDNVLDILTKLEKTEGFVLVVEGSIPADMPEACTIAERPFEDWLLALAPKAAAVVAIGTCAAFGGIPAAEGNKTGAMGVAEFLQSRGINPDNLVINCPSCPAHPISMVGTLAWVGAHGYPEVDPILRTPQMFYSQSTHDNCPRFHDYSKHIFAEKFGDPHGCLFELGCLGPLTFTQCPQRQWNGGVNWCVRASAPCIGCSSPQFSLKRDFPFYRKNEKARLAGFDQTKRTGGTS